MAVLRTVLLIAVLLLGWVALRGGLHPSAASPAGVPGTSVAIPAATGKAAAQAAP